MYCIFSIDMYWQLVMQSMMIYDASYYALMYHFLLLLHQLTPGRSPVKLPSQRQRKAARWDKMRQDETRWDKMTTLDCRLQSPPRSPASLSVLTFEHFGHCFLMFFAMSCPGSPNLPLFRQLKMHSNVQGAFEQTCCSFFLLYHPIFCSLASNFAMLLSKSKAEPAWQFRFEGSVKLPWVSVTSCLECLFHPFSSFFILLHPFSSFFILFLLLCVLQIWNEFFRWGA